MNPKRTRQSLITTMLIGLAAIGLSMLGALTVAQPSGAVTVEPDRSTNDVQDAEPVEDAELGAWSELGDWPLVAIHAAVLDNGKVLSYRGTGDTLLVDLWDPSLGLGPASHTTFDNPLGTNLFCSFTIDDPNTEQKLLIGGETSNSGEPPTFVAAFDASLDAGGLSDFTSMNAPRWYPTVTTLWDGRLLAQGGTPSNFDGRFDPTTVAEVYSTGQGWQLLEGTRDPGVWATENYGWWYPKSHVTPWGAVWNLAWDQMYYLDPDGGGSVDVIGTFTGSNRGGSSSSVMFDTGKVLQVGGGERGSDDTRFAGSRAATVFDLNYDPPLITEAAPMNLARHWSDAVVLPDGKVLVVGGSEVNNTLSGVAFSPEIWDPETDTWTVLAANQTPRLYHSTTLLMPDGSVLTAGGGKSGPVDNFNGELFYPPYLFDAAGQRAAQPVIETAPRSMGYNQSFAITVDPAGGVVDRVTLIKQSNSTHSMNTQIFQELAFSQSGATVTIESPDFATVATPGEYQLFVLDEDGVPSVAKTIRLTGTGLTPPPPLNGGSATIMGAVNREGAGAVGGVGVDLFEANPAGSRGQYLDSSTTDPGGVYAFEAAAGCYVLTFVAPPDQTFTNGDPWFNSGICVDPGETVNVNATLTPGGGSDGTIAGTVQRVGAGGVGGVAIDLFETAADGSRGQYLESTVTSADGTFEFTVSGGCYVLTFIAPPGQTFITGSPWYQPAVCVGPGETSFIDVALDPLETGDATIEGSVQGPGQVGAIGVDLFEAAADGSRGPFLDSTTTDADGAYRFTTGGGCYVLTFIAPPGRTFTNGSPWFQSGVCVDAGETAVINAELSPDGSGEAAIEGVVNRQGGGLVTGVNIDLFEATADGSRGTYLDSTVTDGSGSFSLDATAGCYVLTFIAPVGDTFVNGSPWFQPGLCITGGETATVNATLNP